MDEKISQIVSDILGSSADSLAQFASTKTLDDVTFHDFAKYEFLLNPADYRKIDISPLSADAVTYINDLQSSGSSHEVLEYMADFLVRLESSVKRGCVEGLYVPIPNNNSWKPVNSSAISTSGNLPRIILKPLYTLHRRLIRGLVDLDRSIPNFFENFVYVTIRREAKNIEQIVLQTFQDVQDASNYAKPLFDWVELVEGRTWGLEKVDLESDLEYAFEFYPVGSVNVGVALVYRQRWKAIGTQPGEIVKTIPLGPGQSEKIMTKITRRNKKTMSSESSTETETSTESSDTTKDSTEVVKEATSNQNWSLSANVSYGVGGVGWGGSVSGEAGGSKEKSSKNTTSSLSEMMKKSASKIRRQTKVTVTTEIESGFEETTTSEVMNNNDEVPLTLQYHMLQHQYDVYTYLFSVKNAIFVHKTGQAEHLKRSKSHRLNGVCRTP